MTLPDILVAVQPTLPYRGLLAELCRVSARVYRSGLSRGTSGNISVRTAEGMLITPSGLALDEVAENNVCHVDAQGQTIDGWQTRLPFKPSSEWVIHQALYHARPDCHAVIHAHSVHATLLAACHQPINRHIIAESAYHLGTVTLVPYTMPGSHALANEVAHAATDANCLLLANHGVLVLGEDLREAFYRLELLETIAEMVYKARLLEQQHGFDMEDLKPQWLGREEVAAIQALK